MQCLHGQCLYCTTSNINADTAVWAYRSQLARVAVRQKTLATSLKSYIRIRVGNLIFAETDPVSASGRVRSGYIGVNAGLGRMHKYCRRGDGEECYVCWH